MSDDPYVAHLRSLWLVSGEKCEHPDSALEPLPYRGGEPDPDGWQCLVCGSSTLKADYLLTFDGKFDGHDLAEAAQKSAEAFDQIGAAIQQVIGTIPLFEQYVLQDLLPDSVDVMLQHLSAVINRAPNYVRPRLVVDLSPDVYWSLRTYGAASFAPFKFTAQNASVMVQLLGVPANVERALPPRTVVLRTETP